MDLLNTNLDDVRPGYPVLKAGDYDLTIHLKVEPSKDGAKQMLVIEHVTTTDAGDATGEPIAVGHKFIDRITVGGDMSEKAMSMSQQKLKQLKEAVEGKGAAGMFDMEAAQGQTVTARVSIERDKEGQYDDKNRVAKYLPKE